eukprot:1020628-Pelagomonas_calceolata.AAC.3
MRQPTRQSANMYSPRGKKFTCTAVRQSYLEWSQACKSSVCDILLPKAQGLNLLPVYHSEGGH